jgi:hypothetical protein
LICCAASHRSSSRVVRAATSRHEERERDQRGHRPLRSSAVGFARFWLVSCAELTTRPRHPRASRVVRAADDAISHGAKQARRSKGSSNLVRFVRAELARTAPTRSTRSLEGHRVTPRVVRSAHDTRRTNARPKLPGPVRARLVSRACARDASRHVQKRERRKPQWRSKATDGRPKRRFWSRPPGRATRRHVRVAVRRPNHRTARGPRNPVDEETTRSCVRLRALHRVSQGRVRFGAHASN